MQNINEVHARMLQKKQEQREIQRMFRDELSNNAEYQSVVDEQKTLREKKRGIEDSARSSLAGADKLDLIKLDLKSDAELLSDIALNMIMKNEKVEITDAENVRWLPSFSVRFTKDETSEIKIATPGSI
jgi:hypothetical protein